MNAHRVKQSAQAVLSKDKKGTTVTTRKQVPAKPKSQPGGAASACPISSFLPGTKVLLADGTHKAIDTLKVGDKVIATDPATGATAAKPVLKTITSKGVKRLVTITGDVDGDRGAKTGSVTATDRHPSWVPEYGAWTDAGQFRPGMWLRTSAGTHVQITAVRHEVRHGQRVHNLSAADIHTYSHGRGRGRPPRSQHRMWRDVLPGDERKRVQSAWAERRDYREGNGEFCHPVPGAPGSATSGE
ncbi:polymorphic toxin-type HINT domain-containing protein [Streptosporangium sp. NPDC004379]|uniref:polymorphic toxin-type HINT domain-containing protein n=1 Tax=Streptosporangium sp. NPDC004379 TaxID=3366189 RepID=UPI00368F672D